MYYVIKQGNNYNVVMESLLKETDTILFKSPSAEVAWNECDKYSDEKEKFSDYINRQILNQTIVKGDNNGY